MSNEADFEGNLARLNRDGFLLVPEALNADTVIRWKEILYGMYGREEYEINNSVGNVAFEKLLALQPEASRQLIGHPSAAPYLQAVFGKQCQLRSFRAHLNPRTYLQEWHMDFYDYYRQKEKSGGDRSLVGLCMNTTFYMTDNPPERGRLTFLNDFFEKPVPEALRPHLGYTDDRENPFQAWCEEQAHIDLHPNAGDMVIFFSHIPHQGAKTGDDAPGEIRANVVLHYQQNPMFPGISFVSNPQFTLDTLGYAGTFPFAD
jgi:hypothetical protein